MAEVSAGSAISTFRRKDGIGDKFERDCGAKVIMINADRTPLSKFAHYHLLDQTGKIIPELFVVNKNKNGFSNGKISENVK